jgi:hypothetical protein
VTSAKVLLNKVMCHQESGSENRLLHGLKFGTISRRRWWRLKVVQWLPWQSATTVHLSWKLIPQVMVLITWKDILEAYTRNTPNHYKAQDGVYGNAWVHQLPLPASQKKLLRLLQELVVFLSIELRAAYYFFRKRALALARASLSGNRKFLHAPNIVTARDHTLLGVAHDTNHQLVVSYKGCSKK